MKYTAKYNGLTVFVETHKDGGNVSTDGGAASRYYRRGTKLRAALDTLESLLLAHATAGIRIDSPKYTEGVNTTLDAIMNEYGDD